MRPLIGITTWRRTLDTFYGPDRLDTLSTGYADSISSVGMLPVMFPGGLETSEAYRLVGLVDGVVLSGGEDVDPSLYGEDVTASNDVDLEVDRFEIAVIEAARSQDKPVLAICRGLQILNVALGGSLHQEVTSEDGVHQPLEGLTGLEMVARRHVVRFEDGGTLADLYGSTETKVNTLHHQGVADLAPGLVIEATADDGLIEAARCEGDWWALAVQWHPERLTGEHQSVFSLFRDAVVQSKRASAD